jgi:hypothetical protein
VIGPQRKDAQREAHCSFARFDHNGKCIAQCSKNIFKDEVFIDCLGIKSETVEDYTARVDGEKNLH